MHIFLLLLVFSCGSNKLLLTSKDPIYVEDKLQQFVKRFDQYANRLGVKPDYSMLSVYSTDEEPSGAELAVAKRYSDGSKEIVVYNRFFDTATDVAREIVLFHELGHSTLHQDHRNSSVMQSSQLAEDYYLFYYDYFVEELFHISGNPELFTYSPY